jgi:methyl-accepting chemotaxis protein
VEAGILVATYNSEPSSLRTLMDHLNQQALHLRDICIDLAQSATASGERASQINTSIGEMTRALNLEVQSAEDAIENTRQIAQAMENIRVGAQEQSKAADRVTTAVQQIAQAVGATNQTALVSEQTAQMAMQMAQQGAETIKQTLGQIEKISEAVSASVTQIHDLNKISAQINTIVGTVNDIAEQTNLLALNAAIEAARVGAQGSGFAVVAAEIRGLADLSRKSTKEISSLIREVQRNSGLMVRTVDGAMNQAQTGSHLAAQAGQALDELMRSAGTMKDQTEKVVQANAGVTKTLDGLTEANRLVSVIIEENASATEQAAGNIQRTVEMVNHMTSISKDNSFSIEEIHSGSDDVAERSQQLKENIASLVSMAEDLQGSAAAFKVEQNHNN